jgi:hypothetical protein
VKLFHKKIEKNMNWQEAIKALKEGKKVRQKFWSEGCYIFIGKYNTIELSGEYAAEAHQHLDIVDEIANAFQETLDNNWEILE